jgi:hypothetical protein
MLNASLNFVGQSLTFQADGPGMSIDPVTGQVAISNDALLSGIDVTVTDGSSAGNTVRRFRVTVAAQDDQEDPVEQPPVALAAIADMVLTQGDAPGRVEAAGHFSGDDLSFSVVGAGAAIDASGVISVPTDGLLASKAVVVTA